MRRDFMRSNARRSGYGSRRRAFRWKRLRLRRWSRWWFRYGFVRLLRIRRLNNRTGFVWGGVEGFHVFGAAAGAGIGLSLALAANGVPGAMQLG